ncbi:MAG: site-specific integrase [Chloroflexota bacterium]|nr:site-specific integrase [Chloroflexota bacterium]
MSNAAAFADLPTRQHRDDPLASPADENSSMRVWHPGEVRRFVKQLENERLRALYVLALGTGLRRGELLGLRWIDLDLETCRLKVRQALVLAGWTPTLETPKTRNSRRTVALDDTTVAALRRHRREQAEERLARGAAYDMRELVLVFARDDGSPLNPTAVTKAFPLLAKTAGVPRVRFHDLRHTYATLALSAGVPLLVVSRTLGHATIAETANTYSHVLDTDQAAGAARFDAHVWHGQVG